MEEAEGAAANFHKRISFSYYIMLMGSGLYDMQQEHHRGCDAKNSSAGADVWVGVIEKYKKDLTFFIFPLTASSFIPYGVHLFFFSFFFIRNSSSSVRRTAHCLSPQSAPLYFAFIFLSSFPKFVWLNFS